MNTTILTSVLISLVGLLILALGTVVWFAVRRWVDHVDGLQDSMKSLKDAIDGWASKFVTQTQHQADMERLDSALGRRQMDHCPAVGCPYEKTHGARGATTPNPAPQAP